MTEAESRWSSYRPMARHVAPANAHLLDLVGPPARSLLDIGAGIGNGIEEAIERGWETVGIDLAAEQLALARCLGAPVIRADTMALPLATASVDAAVSNFALIFAGDPGKAVSEARRVVRSGGRLAFTAWTPGGWPQACRDRLTDALGLPPTRFPTGLGRPGAARRLLEGAGFAVEAMERASLCWQFADLDDAVDTLTAAAGGLRMLRHRAEVAGCWIAVRGRLRQELAVRCEPNPGGLALDDDYLAVTGIRWPD